MSLIKRRPPCPVCGGVRQHTMSGGWANDGTLPYTYVRCLDCGHHGLTVSVWLPSDTSATRIDEDRRAAQRVRARRRRGRYPQVKPLIRNRGRRITSDTVEITVRIVPGKVERGLAKRIENLRQRRSVA